MKPNMGTIDRMIRAMIAAIIIGLYFMNIISGAIAIVGIILSIIFLITSFINFCPLYWTIGFSTNKDK
ncbi:MAG: DUF2892 domain-containing protein [Bacteroidota bacterium]|nr:DUF2892 domain-containing protein [Bacteroidota bacterium]